MLETLNWIAEYGDKLGVAAILMLVVVGLVWVIRILYNEKNDCENDRLESKTQIGEIRGHLKVLEAKVEIEQKRREEQLVAMQNLHSDVLKAVVGTNNA